MPSRNIRFLEPRYFGFVIGLLVALLVFLFGHYTNIPDRLELGITDFYFQMRILSEGVEIQEGVTLAETDPYVSDDILIVGIDFNALSRFGRWPFPRSRHADLINSFSRIADQSERESMVLLDLFFVEPSDRAYDDALLVDSIAENERVMVETVLTRDEPPANYEELFSRHDALFDNVGRITSVEGNWQEIPAYFGLQPPLSPYGRAAAGFGHANMIPDTDDVFRRQALVAKSSRMVAQYALSDLEADADLVDESRFERLAWRDREGREHHIPTPISSDELDTLRSEIERRAPYRVIEHEDGTEERVHLVRHYRDEFVPAITLSMAAAHMNVSLSDIEVVFGEHVRLPNPQQRNPETNEWEPFVIEDGDGATVRDEIRIPIDGSGNMLVNYRGPRSSPTRAGYQTFPVRSYAGYAQAPPGPDPDTWPRTRAVRNQIVMVGAFAEGMAADELTTPYGLMYGIEILANALNTILTSQFITYASAEVNVLVLLVAALLVAFTSSFIPIFRAGILTLALVVGYFVVTLLLFDYESYLLNFIQPALAMVLTFVSVIMYRVLTEERDKRRIRQTFGKFVSPEVVNEILENPPELGGVDKELTVMFSDIRGFTSLSEQMSPQELVNHLNVYLSAMTDVILDHRGTLDKYIGDEIMAFWGAPLSQENHALLACRTALRQLEVLENLNAEWPRERRIDIGIGINSGIMTVGNMGSSGRMNYTLMGDNVNLGARLEGTNKFYQTSCIMSEYTYALVRDHVFARELDTIRVKGKNKPVIIYELLDVSKEPLVERTRSSRRPDR